MKFVTDLSKGVLGDSDSEELWSEIIENIPADLLKRKDLKILNLACGHGTEARLLISRMRSLGKTAQEANDSIVLLDKYKQFTNAAKMAGFKNVITANFLEWNTDMKFDVVLGNPPYQSGKGEKGGARSLWRKFIKASFTMVKKDGYVAMVCPGFPHQARDLEHCFSNNTPLVLNNDVSHHFPGIGSDIKYWVVREGKHDQDFIVDNVIWDWNISSDPELDPTLASIFSKTIGANNLFECKQDHGYSSTQFKNDPNDYLEKPKGKCKYPIRHASTVKVCYVSEPTECHFKKKVMMTFSGYPDFKYYDKSNPMSSCFQMSGYIEVNSKKEGSDLINLYSTKLYKFLAKGTKSAGMRGTVNYCLPKVDLSKQWNDELLYKHFKLTDDEIKYVESNC